MAGNNGLSERDRLNEKHKGSERMCRNKGKGAVKDMIKRWTGRNSIIGTSFFRLDCIMYNSFNLISKYNGMN